MLRRDINLLYSLTQATKKKSSSNLMVVLVVGVVLIVGLMTFLFVNAKLTVEKNQSVIDDLDAKLGQSSTLSQKQKEYNELKNTYETQLTAVISELAPQQYMLDGAKMSKTLIDVIMPEDATGTALFAVSVSQLVLSGNALSMTCNVTDYKSAWDFVDYLAGVPLADRPELDEAIAANKNYFSGVESNYSGLPALPSDGEKIEFTLKFEVKWEALQ